MICTSKYFSPLGKILLASDEIGLTGLWFYKQKYFARNLDPLHEEKENETIQKTKSWLDEYFKGKEPTVKVPLHLIGTDFQLMVWKILQTIPFGKFMTYGDIAKLLSQHRNSKVSAQAVGNAVGHNPISIIIPCHRVVGKDGNLTGYAGGIDKKIKLLELEGLNMKQFYVKK